MTSPSTSTCIVGDCIGPVIAREMCVKHYKRWRRYGDPLHVKRPQRYPTGATCSVEGCQGEVKGHGLCRLHLDRVRVYGEPGPAERLAGRTKRSLGPGRTVNSLGYVILWQPRLKKYHFEHRVVLEQVLGRPLADFETVHHRNGIRHDNRPQNLELWVTPPRKGQRVEDLIAWVVEHYPDLVRDAVARLT